MLHATTRTSTTRRIPGGTEGPYREVRGWLEHNLAAFVVMQHLMVNTEITLDGDRATVRTMMVNPMGARDA